MAVFAIAAFACGGKVDSGSSENTTTVTPSTTKPFDACSLSDVCHAITIGQVNDDMTEAFDTTTPTELPSNPEGQTSCTYSYSAPRSDGTSKDSAVVAFACPQPAHAQADERVKVAIAAGGVEIADVGDEAVWIGASSDPTAPDSNGEIMVVSGSTFFTVDITAAVTPQDSAKLHYAIAIAGDVIANL